MRITRNRALLAATMLFPVAATAQKPLALTKPEAEYSEPFTVIGGLRELKDGRVLVSDMKDKSLQIIDFKGGATKVGREGSGPGEYGLPGRLIPLPGDSTAVFDMVNQRYLTINPDGKPGKDWRLEAVAAPASVSAGDAAGRGGRGGGAGRGGSFTAPRGFDARGNIYYEGPVFSVGPDGELQPGDTAPVLRFDRAARRIDTVATRSPRRTTGRCSPMAALRSPAWPTTTSTSSPTRAARYRARRSPTRRFASTPPFRGQAAIARPNGEIWVLRTRRPGDEIPTYDVFDASRKIIGKVALPKNHRLAGFGQGTVYLIRLDDDDLQYLQRYRLPNDAKLTG